MCVCVCILFVNQLHTFRGLNNTVPEADSVISYLHTSTNGLLLEWKVVSLWVKSMYWKEDWKGLDCPLLVCCWRAAENGKWRLERWHSGCESSLCSQRTGVHFPEPRTGGSQAAVTSAHGDLTPSSDHP